MHMKGMGEVNVCDEEIQGLARIASELELASSAKTKT